MASISEKMSVLAERGIVSDEKLAEFNSVPESFKNMIFTAVQEDGKPSFNDEYDKIEKQLEEDKKIKNIYFALYEQEEDEDEKDYKYIHNLLRKLIGNQKANIVTCMKATAPYIRKLLEKDKNKTEKDYKMKLETEKTPKRSGNGKGSKKERFKGEEEIINTEDTAEGIDNKYYFKGDEDITFKKPTYVSKDKSTRRVAFKAVKSKRYLGGEKSKPDDDKCNGTIIWDRAVASKAIGEYISPAKFRARCDGKKKNGDYCSKCANKPIDFFNDTYDFGEKSVGYKNGIDGMTYKDFICEKLEYVNQDEIKTDDSEIDESSDSSDEENTILPDGVKDLLNKIDTTKMGL